MNTTYAQNKTCKEFRLFNNKYQPCGNPVEDIIRAWGQEIAPVRCKECRTKNKLAAIILIILLAVAALPALWRLYLADMAEYDQVNCKIYGYQSDCKTKL